MSYQECHQRRRNRFLEPKPVTGPVNSKDRLLNLKEVAALTRCKLWTVRDKARLNLHITRAGSKNYLWLSQVPLLDWPRTLTEKQAADLIRRTNKYVNKGERRFDYQTGEILPLSIQCKKKRTRQRIRKLKRDTGQMPPLADDYCFRSLHRLDKELRELKASL